MARVSKANPLGLLLDPMGQPHQLRLVRPADQNAGRRTTLCTMTFNHLMQMGQTARFNILERPYQIAAVLIREEQGSFTRLEAFLVALLRNRQMALYNSEHRDETLATLYQETGLGHITSFITWRATVGFLERLGPTQEPAPTEAATADYEDRGGRYDQAYLAPKMQADDMKNAKAFLQYKALSASSLEKFDQWKDDILKAT